MSKKVTFDVLRDAISRAWDKLPSEDNERYWGSDRCVEYLIWMNEYDARELYADMIPHDSDTTFQEFVTKISFRVDPDIPRGKIEVEFK